MTNYCLLVGVLDPDRQADVALLGVGQDHDTDLGPGTILLHIALDADRNIHGSLNGLQQGTQKGIIVNVAGGNADALLPFHEAVHRWSLGRPSGL